MSDISEAYDTLKAANSYLGRLQDLSSRIEQAEEQINNTADKAAKIINETFDKLTENLVKILNTRKICLVNEINEERLQSLKPLEESRYDVNRRMEKTNHFITQGKGICDGATSVEEFTRKSSFLGSLPEIPELREVPFFTFQFENGKEADLVELCSAFGSVSKIAPVQIVQTLEKPGATLVEWHLLDNNNDDFTNDIQEFRLQKAHGDVIQHKHLLPNFSDCYTGPETHYLVKDLIPNQVYSYRVCCRVEGSSSEWSPWSLPQLATTTIKPFVWRPNSAYTTTNDNKIATPTKMTPDSILWSAGPQICAGYSADFQYLEYDGGYTAIGLMVAPENGKFDHDDDALGNLGNVNGDYFFLESTGEISVSGEKKSTLLSRAFKGLKVTFTCELCSSSLPGKLRVTVDAEDKRVIYEWNVAYGKPVYFAAKINSTGTKLMIE